ncbi:hypothetical protein RAD15_34560 [Bradyrhizobium sp. 14AA]
MVPQGACSRFRNACLIVLDDADAEPEILSVFSRTTAMSVAMKRLADASFVVSCAASACVNRAHDPGRDFNCWPDVYCAFRVAVAVKRKIDQFAGGFAWRI